MAQFKKARSVIHFERALFVLGHQHFGKSFQLRSMFEDWRFENEGKFNATPNLPIVSLSEHRLVMVRPSAPQEGDYCRRPNARNLFFAAIDRTTSAHPHCRWNIAQAMRHDAPTNAPKGGIGTGYETIKNFVARYQPERVRIAILNPPQDKKALGQKALSRDMVAETVDRFRERLSPAKLRYELYAEVMIVDSRESNGLMLADFFDFT